MDVASFREILRIQRLDKDEFVQNCVAGSQRRQKTCEEWNRFWSKAARVEKKKRKKPLTVIESKERRNKKAMTEVIQQMSDLRPVAHLLDNPNLPF